MTSPPRIGLLTAWASRANGGVFEAVVAHVELLRAAGFQPHVFALDDPHAVTDRERFGRAPVETFSTIGPRAIGYAPVLLSALRRANLDLLHLHGIWMYPSKAGADWAAATGRPYVISPHGMLDPWITERGRIKKRLARLGYEHRSWRLASLFHALTPAEAADIRRETARNAIAIVPNAIGTLARVEEGDGRFVLYLGRIHPKKNVEALVEAWRIAGITSQHPDARLVIAGWGDPADIASLEAKITAAGPDSGISFLGPVYGSEKAKLLGSARFLALPSHSEGLPVAILEGWAAGTPSLMTEHCNLPQGFARGVALDCGTNPAMIATTLQRAMAMPEAEWAAMSRAASRYAIEEFSLETATRRWTEIYDGLLGMDVTCAVA